MVGEELFAESACSFLQGVDRKETQPFDSPYTHEANTVEQSTTVSRVST
jgi:hypothetical protein